MLLLDPALLDRRRIDDQALMPQRGREDSYQDLLDRQDGVARALAKVPTQHERAIRVWLAHPTWTQQQVARLVGCTQSTVCLRRQRAIKALAWSRLHQPDLTPMEVWGLLSHLPAKKRWALAWSWRAWSQARCPVAPQQTLSDWWRQAARGDLPLPPAIQGFYWKLAHERFNTYGRQPIQNEGASVDWLPPYD